MPYFHHGPLGDTKHNGRQGTTYQNSEEVGSGFSLVVVYKDVIMFLQTLVKN